MGEHQGHHGEFTAGKSPEKDTTLNQKGPEKEFTADKNKGPEKEFTTDKGFAAERE